MRRRWPCSRLPNDIARGRADEVELDAGFGRDGRRDRRGARRLEERRRRHRHLRAISAADAESSSRRALRDSAGVRSAIGSGVSSAASSKSSPDRSCGRAIAPIACSRRTTWGSRRGERVPRRIRPVSRAARDLRPVGHRCRRGHHGVTPPRSCRGPRRRASQPPLRGRRRRAQARDRRQRPLQEES